MRSKFTRNLLKIIPRIFTDFTGRMLARIFSGRLKREICGTVTDKFLELLLRGMDFAFCLSKRYRKNIKNFSGRYVFRTEDGRVAVTATFKNGDMHVDDDARDGWNARVTFKNAAALRAYIFSKNQDILDSVLKNEVEVDGNLNYIYKFGFMARDLSHMLGVGV